MIEIQDLHKSFGKNKVLKGISLEFSKHGTVSAILGPNGSGKTTLIKSILGMVIPKSGQIDVDGENIKGAWAYRQKIGYLPQIARFPDNLKVSELIKMVKDLRGNTTNEDKLIELFELKPFLNKTFRTLSGGTRQKVNLTLTLMYDNPILILDEPTSGLDPVALIQLKKIIEAEKAKGKLILITTHIMSFVEEMADEIVFLLDGTVHFRKTVEEIVREHGNQTLEKAIAEILGYPIQEVKMNGEIKNPKSQILNSKRTPVNPQLTTHN